MVMSFIDELDDAADFGTAWLLFAFLAAAGLRGAVFFEVDFLAATFFAAVFFDGGFFFSGIGMVMPGFCICAMAGVETVASTSALAATNKIDFTTFLHKERRRFETAPPPPGCFSY